MKIAPVVLAIALSGCALTPEQQANLKEGILEGLGAAAAEYSAQKEREALIRDLHHITCTTYFNTTTCY